jgi:ADP-ribose pyrophosphatase YjhB (NUDIX family)
MTANIVKFPTAKKPARATPTLEEVSRARRGRHRSSGKGWSYTVFPAPTPLLSELMASCTGRPLLLRGRALMEAGVLAYRPRKDGELEILLVSKRRSKKWGIPKGRVEPQLSFGELAAKEAFEEAGVIGYISPNSVGMFRAKRRGEDPRTRELIEVWVYLLEVTKKRDGNGPRWTNGVPAGCLAKSPLDSCRSRCSALFVTD